MSQIIIEKAFEIEKINPDPNSIEGDVQIIEVEQDTDMIPSILQIAESIMLHDRQIQDESVLELRHKILDRIIAFYTL